MSVRVDLGGRRIIKKTHTCTPYLAGRRAEDLGRRALGLL
eukprot:COSAG03_NODE_23699_length_278_cov_0.374302_1_plen_39_part_10